jgi:hypothetical protein
MVESDDMDRQAIRGAVALDAQPAAGTLWWL